MSTHARARDAGPSVSDAAPRERAIAPGASVVLLRPRNLRGTIGIVQRPVRAGWEVEIRTPLGTPMHLTVPARGLHLR